ncbi:MAG TPA: type II secretion system protein GspG [bacterium]|nr:type II secretion system protein GspG [bacterium]
MRFLKVLFYFIVTCAAICAGVYWLYLQSLPKVPKEVVASQAVHKTLAFALYLFELDNGRYPTTAQGLRALLEPPSSFPYADGWNGPYIKKKRELKDPWGRPYRYISPGLKNPELYDLSSLGPDGVVSADDIGN